jgi:VanZ family protein
VAITQGRLRYWVPVALWIVFVAFTSSAGAAASRTLAILQWLVSVLQIHISWDQLIELHTLLRKTGHFCNYAILSLLIFRASRAGSMIAWRRTWLGLALLGTLIVAGGDEVHQYFTPGREGTWHDVALDMTGALFAQFILWVWSRGKEKSGAGGTPSLLEKHEQA